MTSYASPLAAVVALLLVVGGCAATDPTSAQPEDTATDGPAATDSTELANSPGVVTLTLANTLDDMPEELIAWVVAVREQAGDSIVFEMSNDHGDLSETGVLRDVAAGTVEMGWVGARALPEFEALLAPMLVDSHELQERVFTEGVPARMLEDLDVPGVTGLAVLPGPSRLFVGVDAELRAPADFTGLRIATDNTPISAATVEALDAELVHGFAGMGLDDVDVILAHLSAVAGNGYHEQAHSLTANLNLWPRPLVVLINTEVFESLSPEQQSALQEAAAAALPGAMRAATSEALAARAICSSPLQIIDLSDDELAAFESALTPVLTTLEEDPASAAYLSEIRTLKDEVNAPPHTLSCENG